MDTPKAGTPKAPDSPSGARTLHGKAAVGAVAAAIVAVVGYFALGMPGMNHSGDTASGAAGGMDHAGTGAMRLGVDEFAARMEAPDAVVVSVHTPYEGEIDGTDLFIPLDRIGEKAPTLGAAEDSTVLLYCRTGRMSEAAAQSLRARGYTNVADLEGGMRAWEDAGRPIMFRR